MRWVLRFSLIAAGAALVASSAEALDLTVVSWGGAYTASQQKAYHDPYMALNPDIDIVNDDSANEGLAKLRAQVEANNITRDLVDMVASDAVAACDEGRVEEIDPDTWLAPAPDGTPASEDFLPGTLTPGGSNCFVPQVVYSTTFGYRTDAFEHEQPSTIADVFDLQKFPGRRSLERRPINNLEWALLADGVAAEDVYPTLGTPEGVDRALAKLDIIKDQVVWWSKGAETPQRLADGEVVIGSTYNGRLFSLIAEKKQPVAMLWDWQILDLGGWVVPKGGTNIQAVKRFLYFATDTRRLADQAKFISYGPARSSSGPLVGLHAELGIDMKPHMPTNPENTTNNFSFDYVWWADHKAEMEEIFNAWLAN
ncbi:MAG: extracellular solute-binding protein [Rhodospirillales bacterium]|nr:extracellular solute-binding protein [Rhodospirillales bacterium]